MRSDLFCMVYAGETELHPEVLHTVGGVSSQAPETVRIIDKIRGLAWSAKPAIIMQLRELALAGRVSAWIGTRYSSQWTAWTPTWLVISPVSNTGFINVDLTCSHWSSWTRC